MRCILTVLLENDVSPFEVTQSGLVPALLTYLTKPHPSPSTPEHSQQEVEVAREVRVRAFLHVFLGCPKNDDEDEEAEAKVNSIELFRSA